ncbi:MAG: PD40 domain-containing protein [Alphaproteobacteria bacterium]|nr:PD40 domain-containing protein [Alphaproteobacteria bacterium]
MIWLAPLLAGCGGDAPKPAPEPEPEPAAWAPAAGKPVDALLKPEEKHLADLRQLTFGGENAEAYWSPDGKKLIYQKHGEKGCDQQFELDLTTGDETRISSGNGRTTCGYYSWPDGDRFIYATTEGGGEACPADPDRSQGYVWPLYDTFDLVWQTPGGAPEPFLASPGYDAEATICFETGKIVFTSTRSGDLELWTVNPDGSDLTQMTSTPGYDGGAFFTPDCSRIVWRASRPEGDALADYQRLLGQQLVRPSKLEIHSMKADGTDVRQHTSNGAANFGPYAYPDGSRIVFASNMGENPREFDLWSVPMEGEAEPERITTAAGFDGFPMFSPDGKWFVFASNRATAEGAHDTNLFVARWVP